MKKIWILITGILLGVILMLIPKAFLNFSGSSAPAISATTLKTSLEQASDLITTKYNYAKVGQFSNSLELNGWTIPFTEKNFILSYQGCAQLGVSMDEAVVDVNEEDKIISVQLPEIKILSNNIDESSIEIYNESTNIFNPIQVDDYVQFSLQQKQVVEDQLEEEGIFDQAKTDARQAVVSLLNMIPEIEENYTIEVTFDETSSSSSTESESTKSIENEADSSAAADNADTNS